ncbi:hypothetical protein N657DRAFT_190675 [Parathielavia appendiculata]|uniref:Uncharacterized protein n=1 Tax=Parathielavia appendiculata TaxID=2587402 RepID=A0AAN6U6C7_9PEZI|nr:hypothetical protein N657DRAFT_190675 [Parathielavia appendiculata]
MGLRDKLRKKPDSDAEAGAGTSNPEFTFIRTDTHSVEVIHPPSADGHREPGQFLSADLASDTKQRRSLDVFRSGRSRSASASSNKSAGHKRLSQRLHLSRSPSSSENVPQDLPEIGPDEDKDGAESQWEKRATLLARENEKNRSRPGTPVHGFAPPIIPQLRLGDSPRDGSPALQDKAVSSKEIDENIQEAIRLHEEGRLEESTALFGKLADPKGANNPLSQVLYGLALRHGWGCQPDTAKAVTYLSAAASNAADIEHLALQAGLKKGGAAKGELVLAIFELANCFRHGWGIPKDPIAAKQIRQYYETAANLGDTDAMNEVAWCYLEGFGTKKDKVGSLQTFIV